MESKPTSYPKCPWLTIWIQPRATIRAILDSPSPMRHVYLLALIEGLGELIMLIWILTMTISIGHWSLYYSFYAKEQPLLFLAILLGESVAGLLVTLLSSVVLSWTGKKLGGTAGKREIMIAIAWSRIPVVLSLFFIVVTLANFLLGNALSALLFLGISVLVSCVSIIWEHVIFLKCLSEVQGFQTSAQSLGNLIMAVIVMMVIASPVIVIAGFLYMIHEVKGA